jgi:hypothetical protein
LVALKRGESIRNDNHAWPPPDLGARLLAAGEERHLPVEEVVKAFLYNFRPLPGRKGTLTEEIDRGFEEAANLIPEGVPPLSDKAISRESIYTLEDDWNR